MRLKHGKPPRAFLLGALAGAAFALLLAPSPGRDTRARVVHQVEHGASEARELGELAARKARAAIAGVAASLDRIAGR
jgi:gas vesicle protein